MRVDVDRRKSVFDDVISQQGPPDGTVIVSLVNESGGFPEELLNEVLEMFGEIGTMILVRYVSCQMPGTINIELTIMWIL